VRVLEDVKNLLGLQADRARDQPTKERGDVGPDLGGEIVSGVHGRPVSFGSSSAWTARGATREQKSLQ
jgi:hypothetical protein